MRLEACDPEILAGANERRPGVEEEEEKEVVVFTRNRGGSA